MRIHDGLFPAIALVLAGGAVAAFAETGVQRGEHLVNEVAKCGDCHTPKLNGAPDRSKWLQGAKIDIPANCEVSGWAKFAPSLGGTLFRHWKETDLKRFLETGLRPDGKAAQAPMPPYRLRGDDAEVMVQYLKSLK